MTRLRRGTRLGKYRLERRLGEGASAEVWLARDTVQDRRVAVKVVPPSVVETFGRAAIEHEARVAARLDHPNVVAVRNADWAGDCFLIVTDPALRSLAESAAARRSPQLALSLLRDAAAGLAYAHGQKVLHRDVKPANILIYPGQVAKLGDFGTARFAPVVTRLQTEVGTMGYMAPEQAYGRPRYASDVFGLALTAFHLLTGRLPTWPFEWPYGVPARALRRIPEPLQPVLRKALHVQVAKRHPDGRAFLQAFDRALAKAQPPSPAPRRRRRKPSQTSAFELETRWFRRQYGRELGLRFECHDCGGPVAEAMAVCPWCGTDRNSFAELTQAPLVCPDCDRGVRAEWTACPWCYPARFEGNGRTPPPDPGAERTCRKRGCDGQLRRFMRYCPMCKTKVTRAWRVPGLDRCRRCDWPTSDRWRFCPWCARRQREAPRIRPAR
jgi:serine/threonine-protein kinase